MTESGTTPERFIRIHRDDPQFSEYLTARFGSADGGRDTFAYRGASYRFTHSSTDSRGMFDVLELVDSAQADKA